MKAALLAVGLMMAGHAYAASVTGRIGVKLTIYSQCRIDGQRTTAAKTPTIDCGKQASAQPRITETLVLQDVATRRRAKLVTVEW